MEGDGYFQERVKFFPMGPILRWGHLRRDKLVLLEGSKNVIFMIMILINMLLVGTKGFLSCQFVYLPKLLTSHVITSI